MPAKGRMKSAPEDAARRDKVYELLANTLRSIAAVPNTGLDTFAIDGKSQRLDVASKNNNPKLRFSARQMVSCGVPVQTLGNLGWPVEIALQCCWPGLHDRVCSFDGGDRTDWSEEVAKRR